MIRAGVDILRLNMAHASHQWVKDAMWFVREVSEEVGRHVAVMMDVKGPEIRTGALEMPIELEAGSEVEFHIESVEGTAGVVSVSVNYDGLPAEVSIGDTVLVDSGLIQLMVKEKDEVRIRFEVLTPGELGSRRHILSLIHI